MKYEIERMFEKDFNKLKDKKLAENILMVIDDVSASESISDIKNMIKMKGHSNAYRIRSGDYRIGVIIEDNLVTFTAFDHRRDIYKRFP
jgi:mRNA interferase RelE/StbE